MKRLRATATALFVAIGAVVAMSGLIAPSAALASPSATVSPRVHCGGFNGHVDWSDWWQPFNVHVWGIVWTTCHRSDTVLQLSYNAPGSVTKLAGQTARQYGLYSNGVNYSVDWAFGPIIGSPTVKVCNDYGGSWHCGSPQN